MCLSATGSPPRRTCARRSLALARAAPTSSNAVEPSVTRRLLAGEIVLDHPSPRAARAQAQSEAAELVIPESLVLRARRQHQRLGGSRCQLQRDVLQLGRSWARLPCALLPSLATTAFEVWQAA